MTKIKVADYIFSEVQKLNVDFVPIYQSGNALHLINAVGENKKIKAFVNYHEQANGLAAEAYGRFKKLGVCCSGSGPAATNLSTAIMSAYCDSIPTFFVTGQVGMFHNKKNRKIRQRGFQEVDVKSHMQPITKYSVLVDKVENIRFELEKCLFLAMSGRPGPVVMDVPYNVQIAQVDPKKLKGFTQPKSNKQNFDQIFKYILKEIKNSSKPMILLGGGAQSLKNNDLMLKFLSKLNLPVVTTWLATDMLYYNYPLNLGNLGRSGNRSAVYSVQESDLLLSFGSRLTTKVITNEKTFAKNAKVISFDIDKAELKEGLIKFHKGFEVNLKDFIPNFYKYLNSTKYSYTYKKEWEIKISELKKNHYAIDETYKSKNSKYVSPYKFMNNLFDVSSKNAIFIPDAGMNITWTYQGNKLKKGQKIFTGLGASPMGYALPASIGAYYATKSNQVVVLAGDGGFQMNIQELQALAFHNLPIKVFILNNESLGNTRFPAQKLFGNSTGNDIKGGYSWPDFVKVAKAYNISAMTFDNKKNFKTQLKKIMNYKKPILVDVRIDPLQFMLDTPI
jgi:acetolactate synthase-1/2/3 large subunit